MRLKRGGISECYMLFIKTIAFRNNSKVVEMQSVYSVVAMTV